MYGSDDQWQLPSLDWLGDPVQLRARARAELAAAGVTHPPERLQGRDASSSVSIEVDARGRVKTIEFSRLWRARLDPARVGPALYAAYGNAAGKALESRVISSVLGDRKRTDRPVAAAGAAVSEDADVRSRGQLFTMRRSGGAVVGISGDPARIEDTDAGELGDEALDLFRTAGLAHGE